MIRYDVRVVNKDGKLVVKKRFVHADQAWNFAEDKLKWQRTVKVIRKNLEDPFKMQIIRPDQWGISDHDAWSKAPGPLDEVFFHTSVTKQLPKSATVAQEKEQMRAVDSIAHARGFNGFSYSWGILPSGRVYEGRGWLTVEAATLGFNEGSDSICFIGNTDAFKLTKEQELAALALIERGQKFGKLAAKLDLRAHNDVAPKACPGRFVTDEMIAGWQRKVNR